MVEDISRLSRRESGAAMVEMSLVMVIFVVLVLGTLDLGMALAKRALVQYASSRATRAAAMQFNGCRTAAVNEYNRVRTQFGGVIPQATISGHRADIPTSDPATSIIGISLTATAKINCFSCRFFFGQGVGSSTYGFSSFYPCQHQEIDGECASGALT